MIRGVPKLSLRLSDEARAGFERGCLAYGVSVTALVEAIGLKLYEDAKAMGARGEDVVDLARQIDAERRQRGLDR